MKPIKKHIIVIIVSFILILSTITIVIIKVPSLNSRFGQVVQNIRFKIITKNMDKKKFDNITYYYSNKNEETYIDNIEYYIKEGEAKIVPLLGDITMYPYSIIMFETPDAFGKACHVNPQNTTAMAWSDSIYIPCASINIDILPHEYTHYKINSLCKEKNIQESKISAWFMEGVAEYVSSTLSPKRFKNVTLKKIQNFKDLNGVTQFLARDNQKAYTQSYIAVKKIVELKGQNAVMEIILNSKSMTFDNSFEKVVGLSIDDFQKLLEISVMQ